LALRIGMIGTGWISSAHLEVLSQVQGVEIVGVAWRDRAKAETRAKPYNAVAYDDWEAMLARERLDGVYVCLAPKLAAEVALGCAGKVRGGCQRSVRRKIRVGQGLEGEFHDSPPVSKLCHVTTIARVSID
jgi:hypothetical protein